MGATLRIRDMLGSVVPWWLSDRSKNGEGVNVGFRFLWMLAAALDAQIDRMVEARLAAYPGVGTPTALEKIGASRGMIRGQGESDDDFAARLLTWLDRSRQLGQAVSTVRAVHEYLAGQPTVILVNRHSRYVKMENGVLSVIQADPGDPNEWDWDSVSHPERAGNWWDFWLIVYKTTPAPQWPVRAGTFGTDWEFGEDQLGWGHGCNREEVDAVRRLVAYHKSATAYCRAIIWIDDPANFNITTGAGLPNGNWGAWGTTGSGARVRSDRNPDFRFWEHIT